MYCTFLIEYENDGNKFFKFINCLYQNMNNTHTIKCVDNNFLKKPFFLF